MSHGNKPTELQELTSRDAMSSTGSFGHPVSTSFTREDDMLDSQQHTQVGAMAPLYQTVPEAGKSHAQYKAEKVRTSTSSSSTHVQPPPPEEYMTPGDPSELNEYDIINDRHVKRRKPHPPLQVRLHSENALYMDQASAEELKHKTLTLDRQQRERYSGVASSGMIDDVEIKNNRCCRCNMVIVWLCFFVLVALVVAIGALVMSLMITFGIYEPSCTCDSESDVTNLNQLVADLDAQLAELRNMINQSASQLQVEKLQQEILQVSAKANSTAEELSPAGIQDILTGGDVTFGAELQGLDFHVNCSTYVLDSCSISPSPSSEPSHVQCETSQSEVDMEGFHTTNVYCAKIDSNGEFNPIVTTLQIYNGTASCSCYVVVPDPDLGQSEVVECGLHMTRCPIPLNINTTVQT